MIRKLVFGLMLSSVASASHAILIDFTSGAWSGVGGASHSQAVAGVGQVTLTSSGGSLTFNDSDSDGCFAGQGNDIGLACMGDGIGIGDDEVTNSTESLTVSFRPAVDVINVYLLDLFYDEPEYAVITLSSGTSTILRGTNDRGGLRITGISGSDITSILFEAQGQFSDYALAAIEVTSVPEPGTLVLLGSGLLGLGIVRRKKAARGNS